MSTKPNNLLKFVYPFVSFYTPLVLGIGLSNVPLVVKNIPFGNYRGSKSPLRGFTLIELVVTIAVLSILVTVAVPSMRTFIQNGRLITQTNDLIGDLNYARSEAIKRRINTGICRSTDGLTFASSGAWRDGRAVFVDTNNNSNCDAGEPILRFRTPLALTDSLNATSIPYPIIFGPNGSSNVTAAGAFFVFCDSRGAANGKQINLNSMGQAAVSTITPGAC